MSEVAQPPDPQRSWNAILGLKQAGLMTIDPPGTPPAVRISPVIQAAIRAAVPKDLYDRAARAAADALLEIWPRDEPRSRLAADLRSCAVSLRQAAGDVLWADGRCHPLLILAGQSMDSARLTGPAVAYWRELAADSERVLGSGSLETLMVSRLPGRGADGGRAGRPRPFRGSGGSSTAARARSGPIIRPPSRPRSASAAPWWPSASPATRSPSLRRLSPAANSSAARIISIPSPHGKNRRRGPGGGQAAEAIRAYRHALADRERIQSARHPDTMTTSLGLADAYLASGQTKDAIAQYKRVLADREGLLGPDHPDTLLARGKLAAA